MMLLVTAGQGIDSQPRLTKLDTDARVVVVAAGSCYLDQLADWFVQVQLVTAVGQHHCGPPAMQRHLRFGVVVPDQGSYYYYYCQDHRPVEQGAQVLLPTAEQALTL